eukprot:2024341-Alexandrium_andersonii.AAC.1
MPHCQAQRRCAKRGASCVWTCRMGVSDFRRFRAADRAVWPVGGAGTAAPSGWILDPRPPLIRHHNDPL